MTALPNAEPIRADAPIRKMVWHPATNTVTVTDEPIVQYAVYFETPTCLVETNEEAVTVCERNDFLPELVVRAVPVAVTASGACRRLD